MPRQVLWTAGREIFYYDKRYDRGESSPLDSEIRPAASGGESFAAGLQCGGRRHRGTFPWNKCPGRRRRVQQRAVSDLRILHRNLYGLLRAGGAAVWRRDYSTMRRFVFNSFIITAVLAVVLTILCALFCTQIVELLATPDDIFADAYIYLLVILLGFRLRFFII